MGNMEEVISFTKEMLRQKPSRGLLKVYVVGSVFALLGTVIGIVETMCHPFSSETCILKLSSSTFLQSVNPLSVSSMRAQPIRM
uniref:G0/G1 switch 2 n=1 Tax=Mola mola TaxID=94237 RepID=A0A3Q3WD24_MOLML